MALTPLGRIKILGGLRYRAWPLFALLTWLYRRSLLRSTRVVAVIGSYGKSSTARAINTALGRAAAANPLGNAWSSVVIEILRSAPGTRHLALEIGIDGPGQMASYPSVIKPDVVVVTSIGSEHGRSFGSIETTRSEKAEMIRPLDESATVVLNGDDPNVLWMKDRTRGRVVTYGLGPENDFQATDVELDWPAGMTFTLRHEEGSVAIRTPLIGMPGVLVALAAATVAMLEGRTPRSIIDSLAKLEPTPGRLEPVRLDNGAYLLQDDYKSSLETIHAALDVLESIQCSRKLIVMGEVSEPPTSQGPLYRELGERMGRIADRLVLVGGNFQRYAAGARAAGLRRESIVDAGRDLRRASAAIADDLAAGDVVLVKGRDTQSLDRIALLLRGRPVRCEIEFCDARIRCARCPMLERGWGNHRVFT